MFLLITCSLFVGTGFLCYLRRKIFLKKGNLSDGKEGWEVLMVMFWFLAVVALVILVFYSLFSYSSQLIDIEQLKKIQANEIIYKGKADSLTKQFAGYLAEAYPKHERDIFARISPEKVSLYMVKYPELQSSQTLVALVVQIAKMQNDYYEQQLKAQDILQNMRFRKVNPWIINKIIPDIPQ